MLDESVLNKEDLRREFGSKYKEYYSTKLFEDEGFERRKCGICGKNFWSIGERERCDDPLHTPYSFFKKQPRHIGYREFWDLFSGFFERNGHASVKRYPVVSRWRQDLYFTIASIQDFQRIENGAMAFEYSKNPLVVPQICLRFNDIENVGVTGRHLTSFMMAGQHAFNWPSEGYWKDKTIELNYRFLTDVLKVRKTDLVYTEDVWAMGDFSEFGPCLESFANGLELVNSVFTQFESFNGKVHELKGKVVDVGWGFERLMWFYTGFGSVYESVFDTIIRRLGENSGIEMENELFLKFAALASELDITEGRGYREKEDSILSRIGITRNEYEKRLKPVHALYAILDHMRTLLFATADGALPSNVGGGYNLRVILRRALSFIEEYGLEIDLDEVAAEEAEDLRDMYPELLESLGTLSKIIGVERERYASSRKNAVRILGSLLSRGAGIERHELRMLYESHGITPEVIEAYARGKGIGIELPEAAYEDIMKGDFVAKEEAARLDVVPEGLPETARLYYASATESRSKVLYVHKNYVVLDKTPFYPEGGGQESDRGTINGHNVVDVQSAGNVIMHITEDEPDKAGIAEGAFVDCKVDVVRREKLMAHHTATHLISAAARSVLGRHAWQEGARKAEEKAHIDIAHYERLGNGEIATIEAFANNAALHGIKVEVRDMERGAAEREYGFSIYQGHGVPSKHMRIIVISDRNGKLIDAEACGGLHLAGRESLLGIIKIINAYRIHDGVDRIEFVAGRAGIEYFGREHDELTKASGVMNAERFGIAERGAILREEYSELMKRYNERDERLSQAIAESIYETEVRGSKSREILVERNEGRETLRRIALGIVQRRDDIVVLAKNGAGDFVCVSGRDSGISALEFAKKAFGAGFKGGGSEKLAEGKAARQS